MTTAWALTEGYGASFVRGSGGTKEEALGDMSWGIGSFDEMLCDFSWIFGI